MKQNKPQPLDLEEFDEILNLLEFFRISEDLTEKQELWFNELSVKIEKNLKKIKQRLKKACEFYFRYEGDPKRLARELEGDSVNNEKVLKQLNKFIKNLEVAEREGRDSEWLWHQKIYDEWLFKLAFKGVFEK